MPHRLRFDPKRPLVAARAFTFMGKAYNPGDPFKPEGADDRLRARQYEARAVNHGPDEEAVQAAADPVKMTESEKRHTYLITAPWLDEPITVRGKANAEKRLAEVRAEGAPVGFIDGGSDVTVEGGEGGWYTVDAPWLDEPEKVQGREAAEARQAELHEAGEPESYKGFTLTAGDNGWYSITKDGVEGDPLPVLKVQGEDNAREVVSQLRAGDEPADTALPAEWTPTPAEGTDGEGGASTETPPADNASGEGSTEETDMINDENKPPVDGDKPNEPGTNQPNGAEVINDQKAAEPGNARSDTDGEGDDGDDTTGTVGP